MTPLGPLGLRLLDFAQVGLNVVAVVENLRNTSKEPPGLSESPGRRFPL